MKTQPFKNPKTGFMGLVTGMLLLVCLLSQTALAQVDASRTQNSIIQLPKDLKLKDQLYVDLNLDGLKDLVLSTGHKSTQFARSLRIHYQQSPNQGFDMKPDEVITLTPDVIAYACGDVDPYPGREILLFTANAVFGYRLGKEGRESLFKLLDCEFLWQLPDHDHVFSWQRGILDFDGNGKVDLCVPQFDGIKIWLQKEAGFVPSPLLKTPKETLVDDALVRVEKVKSSLTLSFGSEGMGHLFGDALGNEPLVSVSHSIHVPLFAEFNGDGRSDIVTQTSNHLHIWQQGGTEPFQTHPNLSLKLPKEDDGDDVIDMGEKQYVVDVNQDKRCDFIMFTRDKSSKKVFTHILIYVNHKDSDNRDTLFDEQGMPQQLIKIAGLPGEAQLDDINGDGYPDLSFVTFRPDLLDQVKTLASKSIELQFLAYFNVKGRFSRRPDITQAVHVSVDGSQSSGMDHGRFLFDLNGDGLLDVLVREPRDHISLRLLRKSKDGIQISTDPAWGLAIPNGSNIVYEQTSHPTKPVLLIMDADQIMHVRFK